MASITFDEIIEAVDKEYDHLVVDFADTKITFRNVLQLAKEERDLIGDLLKSLTATDEESDSDAGDEAKDDEAIMREILTVAAQEKDECKILLDEIGDNAARLLHVFKLYIGATEVPEA